MPLSEDTLRRFEIGDINELVVAAGATIFEGAFVFALKADFTAVVDSPAISTHQFAGVATKHASAGERVRLKHRGWIEMPVTGASAASAGAVVYASDDNTLTLTAGTNPPVGYIHRHVNGTTCIVEFRSTIERDTATA
ncbi:MAG: capsid cement protein [Candidatus Competibacter sp.]|jgi:predicted RecA/RadA family phage recombinase